MPGSFSDYLENELLDHVYGGADYSRPATVYVALFTVTPADAGGGTEVTGGDYDRVAVTNDATNWPAAVGGSKSNGVAIVFPTATADWGTITAVGIFDAVSAGNLLSWSTVADQKTVDSGDTATLPIGSVVIQLD